MFSVDGRQRVFPLLINSLRIKMRDHPLHGIYKKHNCIDRLRSHNYFISLIIMIVICLFHFD